LFFLSTSVSTFEATELPTVLFCLSPYNNLYRSYCVLFYVLKLWIFRRITG
jgi:hypothetical protein